MGEGEDDQEDLVGGMGKVVVDVEEDIVDEVDGLDGDFEGCDVVEIVEVDYCEGGD